MARARGTGPEFPAHLHRLYAAFPFARSLADDPLSCVRPYARDPRAAEIAGLIAATLAVGNTTAIRGAFRRVAEAVDDDFPGFVEGTSPANFRTRLGSFRHRWIRGDQIGYLALRMRRLYESYPTLESLYLEGSEGDPGGFPGGIHALARGLRGSGGGRLPPPPPGYTQLFPSPLETPTTACKRMTLYVRWMVRDRFPDLGSGRRSRWESSGSRSTSTSTGSRTTRVSPGEGPGAGLRWRRPPRTSGASTPWTRSSTTSCCATPGSPGTARRSATFRSADRARCGRTVGSGAAGGRRDPPARRPRPHGPVPGGRAEDPVAAGGGTRGPPGPLGPDRPPARRGGARGVRGRPGHDDVPDRLGPRRGPRAPDGDGPAGGADAPGPPRRGGGPRVPHGVAGGRVGRRRGEGARRAPDPGSGGAGPVRPGVRKGFGRPA